MEACTKIGGPTVVALAARHRLVHQRLACKNDAIVAQSVYSFIGRGGGSVDSFIDRIPHLQHLPLS
jgi:hypothetical protein